MKNLAVSTRDNVIYDAKKAQTGNYLFNVAFLYC